MDGNNVIDSNPVAAIPLEWQIVGLKDFNGDNNTDILWRHADNGQVWLYQMDGNNVIDSNPVAGVALTWNII